MGDIHLAPPITARAQTCSENAMSFFAAASSSTPATAPAEKDIELSDPPNDSISALAFSPQADYIAVGSWNNEVRFHFVLLLEEKADGWMVTGPDL